MEPPNPTNHPDFEVLLRWLDHVVKTYDEQVIPHERMTPQLEKAYKELLGVRAMLREGESTEQTNNLVDLLLAFGAKTWKEKKDLPVELTTADLTAHILWPLIQFQGKLVGDWEDALRFRSSTEVVNVISTLRKKYHNDSTTLSEEDSRQVIFSSLIQQVSSKKLAEGLRNLCEHLSDINKGGSCLFLYEVIPEIPKPPTISNIRLVRVLGVTATFLATSVNYGCQVGIFPV